MAPREWRLPETRTTRRLTTVAEVQSRASVPTNQENLYRAACAAMRLLQDRQAHTLRGDARPSGAQGLAAAQECCSACRKWGGGRRWIDFPNVWKIDDQIKEENMTETRAVETCRVEGCTRPPWGERGMGCCSEHEAVFDAASAVEEWELALSILRPWYEASKPIGIPVL